MAPPPDSANAEALAEAMALESAGDADAALRIYLALAARDPQNVDAAYRAGTALMRRGELDDAVTMLRRVVFNQPDHGPARANLGNALLLLGRDEPAREAFVAVLERSPDNRNALYGLATILIRLGRHQEAQRYSSRLLAALPDSAAALTLDADARGASGGASALAQYRQALRLDPDYVPALRGLAKLLFHQSRHADAQTLVRRALAHVPDDAEFLALLGSILLASDDWSGALDAFSQARRNDPDTADHAVNMSLACRRGGDIEGAVRHARDAWQIDGESRAAANALGAALAAAGAGIQARQVLMAGGRTDRVPVGLWGELDALLDHLEREAEKRRNAEAQSAAAAHAATVPGDHDRTAEAGPEEEVPSSFEVAPAGPRPSDTGPEGEDAHRKKQRGDDEEPETLPLFPDF
jgi:tetratricopeptide (TPR) repeat protein